MVLAGTHPDLDLVGKPADKSFLPLELFIGEREHRRQEGLCHNISLKPFMGGRKIAVIDDADFLNAEGANCLLKTLEEPPPRSVLDPHRHQPGQTTPHDPLALPIGPLPAARRGGGGRIAPVQGPGGRRRRAAAAGPVRRGQRPAGPGTGRCRALGVPRHALRAAWRPRCWRACGWRRAVSAFVEEAGKEAPARRARLRQVVGFAAEFLSSGCSSPKRRRAAGRRRTCGVFSTRRPLVPPAASRPRPPAWTAAWTRRKRSTATPIKRR